MSDKDQPGFARLVPGFDFLQNLAKGSGLPQLPNLSNWVAPTLNVEELDKRIGELKAVHFWLDQNSKALAATIQALEVQKMTLATLQGMNFDMAEMANALKLEPAEPEARKAAPPASSAARAAEDKKPAKAAITAGLVDPLQWWGSLTQQFQQIAADAMKDVGRSTAMHPAGGAGAAAAGRRSKAAAGKPARKGAPRKKTASAG